MVTRLQINKTTEVMAVKSVVRDRCNSTHTVVKIARKMDVQVIIAGPPWRLSRIKRIVKLQLASTILDRIRVQQD